MQLGLLGAAHCFLQAQLRVWPQRALGSVPFSMLPVSCIDSVAVGRNVGAQSVARIVTELPGEDGAVGVLLHAVAVGAPTFPLALVARLVIKEHHTHTVAPPIVKLAEVLFAPARVIWRVEACAHPLALARLDGAEVERVGHKR